MPHPPLILPGLFHHLVSGPDQDPNSLLGAPLCQRSTQHPQGWLRHPSERVATRADDAHHDLAALHLN